MGGKSRSRSRKDLRNSLTSGRVVDLLVDGKMGIRDLVKRFESMGGFMAPRIAEASEILKEMTTGGTTVFL
ncbi:MAG: hypothetical protein LUQ46_00435, partial [Candidatus Methanomethyliaceae archaeon]|nr:hypothetical protein [Candidatus Methanomethyliaceae archaeon]